MQRSFRARLAALEALEAIDAATVDYGPDALTPDELAGLYGALEDGELALYRGVLMGAVNMYLGAVVPASAWLNVTCAKADRAMVRYRRVVGDQAAQTPIEWRKWIEVLYAESQ